MTFPTGLIVLPLFDESIYLSNLREHYTYSLSQTCRFEYFEYFQRYMRPMADSASIIRAGELRLSQGSPGLH